MSVRFPSKNGAQPPFPTPADPLVGQTLDGDLLIRHILARGGESVAYVAEQTSVANREVVVKVVDALFWRLTGDENHREANPYLKEARVATLVHHPAFAHVYRLGAVQDGRPYIALEYVRGETLEDRLKKEGGLPLALVGRLFHHQCSALRALHASGIILRDLKPSHCILEPLVGGDTRLRVLDLGHAKGMYQTDLRARMGKGEPVGSPGYMSPELAEGRPGDERSDIFTLGLIAYEMIAGVPAIHIATPSAENLVAYVRSDAPLPTRSIGQLRESLPTALDEEQAAAIDGVLARALDRRTRDRFATVAELENALLPLLEDCSSPSTNRARGWFSRILGR